MTTESATGLKRTRSHPARHNAGDEMAANALLEPTSDRNATANEFSGGSPPLPGRTRAVHRGATQCPQGHSFSDPGTYYLTRSGLLQCIQCRLAYIKALQ